MLLYLLRHADADTEAETDEERPLSEKGRAQAARVGRFCLGNKLLPAVILTSPVLRALQTAEIFSTTTDVQRVLPLEFLACGMAPETALENLAGYDEFESAMIVGHEPDFSLLASSLTGIADPGAIRLRKGSLTMIDIPDIGQGRGTLVFSLPVKFMPQ